MEGDDEEYGWDISIKDEDRVWYVIGDDEYGSDIDMSMSSDSEDEDSDSDSDSPWASELSPLGRKIRFGVDGGLWMIYPSPVDLDHHPYRHANIIHFSKRSIADYNRDTGHRYEFVELVEAFVAQDPEADLVTTIFKACQPNDLTGVTSFKAQTYSPSRSILDPNLDIKVVPLHSESDTSSTSTSGSESGLESPSSEDKLKTRFE